MAPKAKQNKAADKAKLASKQKVPASLLTIETHDVASDLHSPLLQPNYKHDVVCLGLHAGALAGCRGQDIWAQE